MTTEYTSLAAAMDAGDALGEARLRYRLLAETFEAEPKLRGNLAPALERAKDEVMRLSAAQSGRAGGAGPVEGRVVAFDPARFQPAGRQSRRAARGRS